MSDRTPRTVERYERPAEEPVAEETLVEDEHAHASGAVMVRGLMRTLSLWVVLALAVVETLLGFRLAFFLADANRTGFVDFIYDVTGPLIQPFEGIASIRDVEGAGLFEPASVIAMCVYLLAALLAVAALWLLSASPTALAEPGARQHARRRIVQH